MATQTVEFRAASGLTLTVRLFIPGSDTVVQTASAVTEATNRKGTYAATFTDPGAAEFELIALSGTTPVCRWFCTLTLSTATFQAYEVRTAAVVARVTANADQWGGVAVTGMPLPTTSYTTPPTASTNATAVRTELTTELNRIDATISSRLATASYTTPPTVAQVVTGVYAALPADHTVSGSYGVRFILALNSNRTVQVTGSNHIAADVHEFQTDVITANAIAASAVTEIQAGLATAANLLIVSDRVSYSLAVLVGACSDAQTAAETYTLTIGGNTFTVDYTGLDSSGNRSTTTLSKI